MAAEEKKTSELPIRSSASGHLDRLVLLSANTSNTANVKTTTIGLNEALANTANLYGSFVQLRISSPLGTPANSTSTSVLAGTLWSDGTYLYIATANNVVKRSGSAFVTF